MTMPYASARAFLARHEKVAVVRIVSVEGSSPREEDTWMLVSDRATYGTIGGGQLEYMAIDEACALIAKGELARTLDIPLGPEIGQCCGGRVQLSVDRVDGAMREELILAEDAERKAHPTVYLFGAGHVGRALSEAFQPLPVHTVIVDTRATELSLIDDRFDKRLVPMPEELVRSADPGSVFIVLTHDHSLDFLIASEALARADAAYVGMIGSRTKRATFESWCSKAAERHVDTKGLVCPIGAAKQKDKRPEVIAAYVAAEVMAALACFESETSNGRPKREKRERAHDQ
ncbi:MAG: xanthine dehydrogenase accessory protein XdhC [Pseudomonadota bacterium]